LQPKLATLNGIKLAALTIHSCLGLVGGLAVLAMTPIAISWLAVSSDMRDEVQLAFLWMAVSVPAIVITSSYRGVLEGLHRFDLVNIVRIPANMANYIGPLLAMNFLPSRIDIIVATIVVGRYLVLLAYGVLVRRLTARHFGSWALASGHIGSLARFGGWMSVVNFSQPSVVLFDRFLIGSVVSLSAVSFYAVPYEIISKLWIFSSSILGVLFPLICSVGADDRESLASIRKLALAVLISISLLICGLGLVFAPELLGLWVGDGVARESAVPARILCMAMFFSVISQVPFTILNGVGRSDITGKLMVFQFIAYALLAAMLATYFGILGVAVAWLVKVAFEMLVLLKLESQLIAGRWPSEQGMARSLFVGSIALTCFGGIGVLFDNQVLIKFAVAGPLMAITLWWTTADLFDGAVRADFRNWLARSY
jgi:O-antigen/teichoic acid export membrane protein